MVRSGLALSYTRYSHVYDADEKTAREERAGLWSGAFIRPEAWRHRDKLTEILAAVSVPVDAQQVLLRPGSRGKISAKILEQTPTETPTPSPGPTATPPTAPPKPAAPAAQVAPQPQPPTAPVRQSTCMS